MSTCQKCGAKNKPGATICRMCAGPLDPSSEPEIRNESMDPLLPTIIFPQVQAQQQAPPAEPARGSHCPVCRTANEAGWKFCQQCGSKLAAADEPPAAPEPRAAKGQQAAVPGAPTIVANLNEEKPPVPSPKPGPKSTQERSSVRPPGPLPEIPSPSQAEAVAARPPQNVQAPPRGLKPETAGDGMSCPQCGHSNAYGSSFCAGCGQALPVAKTIVMSSAAPPARARISLVMEGGQLGEVYPLKDETIIGRTQGDISFTHDGFMSSRHALITRRGNSFILQDEGSRNGTFIRITSEVELQPGDMILIGKQLFRFDI